MENVKQKAREMFDELESFDSFFASLPADEEPLCKEIYYIRVIQPFIDQIIDLAIAERDRNIVEIVGGMKKLEYGEWVRQQTLEEAKKDILLDLNHPEFCRVSGNQFRECARCFFERKFTNLQVLKNKNK